jgi:hypothetical protein
MRLLQCDSTGNFTFTQNLFNNFPPYAVLSHTWGPDGDEVTFQEMQVGVGKDKAGYDKIQFCGRQAANDGLNYFWVDTCCIDKLSSAELSEAINTMFKWYRNAAKCYALLSDVSTDACGKYPEVSWEEAFHKSRWFTRGWTLQELIAPARVEFYSKEGHPLGNKELLEEMITERTGVPVRALRASDLSSFSPRERMSWARNRETKREEDMAYCLLGIFNIYMPLLYGEGVENAFRRLWDEISKLSKGEFPAPSPPPHLE